MSKGQKAPNWDANTFKVEDLKDSAEAFMTIEKLCDADVITQARRATYQEAMDEHNWKIVISILRCECSGEWPETRANARLTQIRDKSKSTSGTEATWKTKQRQNAELLNQEAALTEEDLKRAFVGKLKEQTMHPILAMFAIFFLYAQNKLEAVRFVLTMAVKSLSMEEFLTRSNWYILSQSGNESYVRQWGPIIAAGFAYPILPDIPELSEIIERFSLELASHTKTITGGSTHDAPAPSDTRYVSYRQTIRSLVPSHYSKQVANGAQISGGEMPFLLQQAKDGTWYVDMQSVWEHCQQLGYRIERVQEMFQNYERANPKPRAIKQQQQQQQHYQQQPTSPYQGQQLLGQNQQPPSARNSTVRKSKQKGQAQHQTPQQGSYQVAYYGGSPPTGAPPGNPPAYVDPNFVPGN